MRVDEWSNRIEKAGPNMQLKCKGWEYHFKQDQFNYEMTKTLKLSVKIYSTNKKLITSCVHCQKFSKTQF